MEQQRLFESEPVVASSLAPKSRREIQSEQCVNQLLCDEQTQPFQLEQLVAPSPVLMSREQIHKYVSQLNCDEQNQVPDELEINIASTLDPVSHEIQQQFGIQQKLCIEPEVTELYDIDVVHCEVISSVEPLMQPETACLSVSDCLKYATVRIRRSECTEFEDYTVHYTEDDDQNEDSLKEILLNEFGASMEEFIILEEGRLAVDDNGDTPSEVVNTAKNVSNDGNASALLGINVRKRRANPELWKRNSMKKLRQSGKEFINASGKHSRARRVVQNIVCRHLKKCKFECDKFCEMQQNIHEHFWSLSDQDKCQFYARTTERYLKKESRVKNGAVSRRKYTFGFFFVKDGKKLKVCRSCYLNTLDISAKRIEFYHERRIDKTTGLPISVRQGKHAKKCLPSSARQAAYDHIASFPVIESQYCRATSSRKYLDSTLSVEKMYNMFCDNFQDTPPVKLSAYRNIFNQEFNLSFHVPKKDMCDYCEELRCNSAPSDEDMKRYENHQAFKIASKTERDQDRSIGDTTHAVISFDLENVISLPRANIKSFYFRRKLSVFNLTAQCSIDKSAYCAVWCEGLRGRNGNDIASALIAVLTNIVDANQEIKTFTLWSDACVAQNKNSVMSLALLLFLSRHPHIEWIKQKCGTPGHSPIQEVDNIHSQIEQVLRKSEVHSPVSLLKLLKRVNLRKPFTVIEMKNGMFFDYHSKSKIMKFKAVPYTKVVELRYNQCALREIQYRLSFTDEIFVNVIVNLSEELPAVQVSTHAPELNKDKVKDLNLMLKFMPAVDQDFYLELFGRTADTIVCSPAVDESLQLSENVQPATHSDNNTSIQEAVSVAGRQVKSTRIRKTAQSSKVEKTKTRSQNGKTVMKSNVEKAEGKGKRESMGANGRHHSRVKPSKDSQAAKSITVKSTSKALSSKCQRVRRAKSPTTSKSTKKSSALPALKCASEPNNLVNMCPRTALTFAVIEHAINQCMKLA